MKVLINTFSKYSYVFTVSATVLLNNVLPTFLKKHGYKVTVNNTFVFAVPEQDALPVMVVAHVDTVHSELPAKLFVDKALGEVFAHDKAGNSCGVGADDRAGVALIMRLLDHGLRPYVLFTDGEERGGIGASDFVRAYAVPPVDVRFLVEFDRKGNREAVFYDCGNNEFIRFVKSFGFEEDVGSFTDISIICPAWDVAGVNLSVGYKMAHTQLETLVLEHWDNTFQAVIPLLKASTNAPVYDFQEKRGYWRSFGWYGAGKYGYRYEEEESCVQLFVDVDDLVLGMGISYEEAYEILDLYSGYLEEVARNAVMDAVKMILSYTKKDKEKS